MRLTGSSKRGFQQPLSSSGCLNYPIKAFIVDILGGSRYKVNPPPPVRLLTRFLDENPRVFDYFSQIKDQTSARFKLFNK